MKKSEMDCETTYLLCPDKSCRLFFDKTQAIPCERMCPRQEQLRKIILCGGCQETIILPGAHSTISRVDHNCPTGCRAGNFQRMSGKYRLMYEMPTSS